MKYIAILDSTDLSVSFIEIRQEIAEEDIENFLEALHYDLSKIAYMTSDDPIPAKCIREAQTPHKSEDGKTPLNWN